MLPKRTRQTLRASRVSPKLGGNYSPNQWSPPTQIENIDHPICDPTKGGWFDLLAGIVSISEFPRLGSLQQFGVCAGSNTLILPSAPSVSLPSSSKVSFLRCPNFWAMSKHSSRAAKGSSLLLASQVCHPIVFEVHGSCIQYRPYFQVARPDCDARPVFCRLLHRCPGTT